MIPLTMLQRESSSLYYAVALGFARKASIQNRRDRIKNYRCFYDGVVTQENALSISTVQTGWQLVCQPAFLWYSASYVCFENACGGGFCCVRWGFVWWRVRPETSFIFLLPGTGIFLVLFYIYPIVPYAPGFLQSFLLLVTVVKGIGSKHPLYFYSLVLEFFLCYSIYIR